MYVPVRDGTRLAIAGDSVGGNMTAAVTLMAKQRGGPSFAQQVLFYPVTDATFTRRARWLDFNTVVDASSTGSR